MHPAPAYLCVNEPAVLHEADTARHRADPVLAHGAKCRAWQCRMAESCPVEIALNAEQKVAALKIIASLNATNELGDAAVEIVVWNIQAAAGPRSAEIRANIKS